MKIFLVYFGYLNESIFGGVLVILLLVILAMLLINYYKIDKDEAPILKMSKAEKYYYI